MWHSWPVAARGFDARNFGANATWSERACSSLQCRLHLIVAQACFACRRSFKIAEDPLGGSAPTARCPGCGDALRWMGRTFKTPKQSDVAQWKMVEALWNEGFRFFSYRSHPDAERLPSTLGEVSDFVRRNPRHPFRIAPPVG